MIKPIKPIRIEGNLAYVTLTRGYHAVIDAADVSIVAGYNWYATGKGHCVYGCRGDYSGEVRRTVLMHRAILGEVSGMSVDHCDGDGLNNRRANLRLATHAQNMRLSLIHI
jgi:hypothetical protein